MVYFNCTINNVIFCFLDCIYKSCFEKSSKNRREDLCKDLLACLWYANYIKVSHKSWSKRVSSSSWWGCTGNDGCILNILPIQLFSIIKSSFVNKESKQLYWRLGSVKFYLWHVHIINKYRNLLSWICSK